MSEFEQRLQQVTDLVSLPEVYARLRRLVDDPESRIRDFAEVVQVDPNLTSRLLRIVNSAYFGFAEPVDNVARAINLLGIAQLHNLVLGISAISSLRLPSDLLPLDIFWRRSLFAGVLAHRLGEHLGIQQAENLFIAGLLNRIGQLVLATEFEDEARQVAEQALAQGLDLHQAEKQLLGLHYGEIGAVLMAHWNLPRELRELTRHQPEPASAGERRLEAAVLNLAQACAAVEISGFPEAADSAINAKLELIETLSQEDLEPLLEQARQISADMEKIVLA